jgi:hypothetical protein
MAFPIGAAIAGVSALLGAFGKNKSKKAAQKKEQDEARLKFESQKKAHGQSEKRRIAGTRQLASAAGSRGIKGFENLPPEFLEEQEFTGAPPSKESGRSGFGEFLEGVGGIGTAAGDFINQSEQEKKQKAELDEIMCTINPSQCNDGFVSDDPQGF